MLSYRYLPSRRSFAPLGIRRRAAVPRCLSGRAFGRQERLDVVVLRPACDAIMNPPAVATRIFPVDLLPRVRLQPAVNGFKLPVGETQHDGKGAALGKDVAQKAALFPVGNAPSVLISVREYDLLLGAVCPGQPFVDLRKPFGVLPAKGRHIRQGRHGMFVKHSLVHTIPLIPIQDFVSFSEDAVESILGGTQGNVKRLFFILARSPWGFSRERAIVRPRGSCMTAFSVCFI